MLRYTDVQADQGAAMKTIIRNVLAVTFAMASTSVFAGMMYQAQLVGGNEVPPVLTDATGLASFELNAAGTELDFQLELFSIDNVVAGHIHAGAAGTNGPVVAVLIPNMAPSGLVNGLFASGTILETDLIDTTLSDFTTALNAGTLYVNVHTTDHPPGEIRGQIRSTVGVSEPSTISTLALAFLGLALMRRRVSQRVG